MEKTVLKDLNPSEMREYMVSIGELAFRGDQITGWIYKGAEIEDMVNLPLSLRKKLAATVSFDHIETDRVSVSKDGTAKYLFRLPDGNEIETVYMEYDHGRTVCVSSQAGCAMGCSFCASGIGGLKRDLRPWEMAGQVILAGKEAGERISHVVVMGTGEPFSNYDNVVKFIRNIHDSKTLGISMRNITVSTCGIIPGIDRFAEDLPQCTLAISLHAPKDELRNRIMPVNRKYGINDLMEATERYIEKTGRRVTYEYALIAGVNDSVGEAEDLAKLLKGRLAHVNLIPLNKVSELGLAGSKKAKEFCALLNDKGINATVRRTLGADIEAACGQLRLKSSRL